MTPPRRVQIPKTSRHWTPEDHTGEVVGEAIDRKGRLYDKTGKPQYVYIRLDNSGKVVRIKLEKTKPL